MSKAVAGHRPRYQRFSRGRTPIKPQRTLYGHMVECSGGDFAARTNEDKSRAAKLFEEHLDTVRAGQLSLTPEDEPPNGLGGI